MSGITTHVLDTTLGRPAAGVLVVLAQQQGTELLELGRALTDADGRVRTFPLKAPLLAATYRLSFETAAHFRAAGRDAFFERVIVDFVVADPSQHYHVPLLITPYGYTTYRGS
jgi:5-hydroxyisourate hydrolase